MSSRLPFVCSGRRPKEASSPGLFLEALLLQAHALCMDAKGCYERAQIPSCNADYAHPDCCDMLFQVSLNKSLSGLCYCLTVTLDGGPALVLGSP